MAQTLKLATRGHHAAAERAGLMRELLHGRIERRSYCSLLRNLYELYAALEPALIRQCSHAAVAPVFLPHLFRKDALDADLRDLHGDRWMDDLDVKRTTLQYVDRLREIDTLRPELLVAHAYVRYLGDLNGGQILERVVRRSLHLPRATGTRFFEFGQPEEVATKVREFRLALDSIVVDATGMADIVAEAQLSFVLHARLFEELLPAAPLPEPAPSIVDRQRPHLPV